MFPPDQYRYTRGIAYEEEMCYSRQKCLEAFDLRIISYKSRFAFAEASESLIACLASFYAYKRDKWLLHFYASRWKKYVSILRRFRFL
jgi:hypothetical protein